MGDAFCGDRCRGGVWISDAVFYFDARVFDKPQGLRFRLSFFI